MVKLWKLFYLILKNEQLNRNEHLNRLKKSFPFTMCATVSYQMLSSTILWTKFIFLVLPFLNLSSVLAQFIDHQYLRIFIHFLDRILESNKNFILMGEINLDLLNTSDAFVNQYSSIININDYSILNKCTPQYCTRTSRILDHAVTNIADKFSCDLKIGESHISDHKYLLLKIALSQAFSPIQLYQLLDQLQVKTAILNFSFFNSWFLIHNS